MSDRSVKVGLGADPASFIAGTRAAAASVEELAKVTQRSTQATARAVQASSALQVAALNAVAKAAKGSVAEQTAAARLLAQSQRANATAVKALTREQITAERTAAAEQRKRATASAAASRAAVKSSHDQAEASRRVGGVLLGIGAAVGLGLGAAGKAAMDFDKQMSLVGTLAKLGPASAQLAQLRAQALSVGQGIGYSATQVADAEAELVKGGVSVSDIMGGALKSSLNLAAAGQLAVADATQITVVAMTQFGLKAKDAGRISDELAAGADKALGSVGDLGAALAAGGVGAQILGQDLEHTVGTLAQFAQNGIVGENAGTLFRQMLSNLAAPSAKGAAVMEKYGFSVRDASGHMKNTTQIAGALQKSFGHLSDAERDVALKTIAGRYAFQGLVILLKGGAAENAKWVKTIQDQGFATQQASGKMNNLAGDLSKLKAAFENGLINTGETATGTLRALVKGSTAVLKAFDDLSPASRTLVVEVGAGVAAIALAGGTALIAVPKFAATKKALQDLGLTAGKTAAALDVEAASAEAASLAGKGRCWRCRGQGERAVEIGQGCQVCRAGRSGCYGWHHWSAVCAEQGSRRPGR